MAQQIPLKESAEWASGWLLNANHALPVINAHEDAPHDVVLATQLIIRAADRNVSQDIVSLGSVQINAALQSVEILQLHLDVLKAEYERVRDDHIDWLKDQLAGIEIAKKDGYAPPQEEVA